MQQLLKERPHGPEEIKKAMATILSGGATEPPADVRRQRPALLSNAEFLEDMRAGKPKLGMNLNRGNPLVAELTAAQGFDWCMVDCQHSPYSSRNMAQMFTAIQMTGAKAWVRVGGPSDRFGIQQAFDVGADGILVPYVNTADDVRAAVSVAKYPGKEGKEGTRSLYLNIRAQYPGGVENFMKGALTDNKRTIVAVQIETAAAVENLDEILQVPGLDIAFIGPGDLCSSMGLLDEHQGPGAFGDPRFGGALQKVLEGCAKNDVIPGFWSTPDNYPMMVQMGFKFVVVSADLHSCQASIQNEVAKAADVAAKAGFR